MLAALIEERHDDIDTARLPSDRGDDTLQILKVVVRGHVVDLTVQGIGQAVVADIHHQVQVLAAYRFGDNAFRFSGTKARNAGIDKKSILLISGKSNIIAMLVCAFAAPFDKIIINFLSEFLTSGESDEPKASYRNVF